MAAVELWHNPRCSKSRATKQILDERGTAYVERQYLDDPPSVQELDTVLTALGREPWDVARLGEDVAKDLGMPGWEHDRTRWIEAMVTNPILIERPILVADDGRAAMGRPPEAVIELL